MVYQSGNWLWCQNLMVLHEHAKKSGIPKNNFRWHPLWPMYLLNDNGKQATASVRNGATIIDKVTFAKLYTTYKPTIRALAWKQPFGSLMLHGKIETRTYKTNTRGTTLIYTSLQEMHPVKMMSLCYEDQIKKSIPGALAFDTTQHLHGFVLGMADLVDCRPMKEEDEEKTFVAYDKNKWCWIFDNVFACQPFRFLTEAGKPGGRLSFQHVKQYVLDQIIII
jgi:hypothetical protein